MDSHSRQPGDCERSACNKAVHSMLNIDDCAKELADFVISSEPRVSGPHEIAYGFGWAPSISYWIGQRRVHLYEDYCDKAKTPVFAVEIADNTKSGRYRAQRCRVTDMQQIRDIMARFLCQSLPVADLLEYTWISDNRDANKSIPDPPNRSTPANFSGFVGGHFVAGGPPQIEPTTKRKKPWWKVW
jgi:hypothetical protein